MTYKQRIDFISSILSLLGIPYTVLPIWEGWQLRFPWCIGDVACHDGTYGSASGMVESYEFPWDEGDVSVLTPQEATIKIIAYYNEKTEKE